MFTSKMAKIPMLTVDFGELTEATKTIIYGGYDGFLGTYKKRRKSMGNWVYNPTFGGFFNPIYNW